MVRVLHSTHNTNTNTIEIHCIRTLVNTHTRSQEHRWNSGWVTYLLNKQGRSSKEIVNWINCNNSRWNASINRFTTNVGETQSNVVISILILVCTVNAGQCNRGSLQIRQQYREFYEKFHFRNSLHFHRRGSWTQSRDHATEWKRYIDKYNTVRSTIIHFEIDRQTISFNWKEQNYCLTAWLQSW